MGLIILFTFKEEFSDLKNFMHLKYKDTNTGLKNNNNPVNITIFHFIINKNNKILSNKQRKT